MLGTDVRPPYSELAKSILLTGSDSEIIHAEERAGDVRHSVASVEKLREGWFLP